MPHWTKVCQAKELPTGTMQYFGVGDREILVANIEGRFYAIANRCGHMNMPLSYGLLEGRVITCALHGAKFNVTTGQVIQPAPFREMNLKVGDETRAVLQPKTRPCPTFAVMVRGDEVLVDVESHSR